MKESMRMSLGRLFAIVMMLSAAAPLAAQDRRPATPEARKALAVFAQCVAASSPAKAHSALTRDFRTSSYRQELRVLAETNRDCHKVRASMRFTAGLPFSAALAEALIHRDPTPLKSRLARAAGGNHAPTYAPSDAVAMCIARSVPDDVTALLSAPIASPAEAAAARLATPLRLCNRGRPWIQTDTYGLRAMVATATYRLLAAQGQGATR